MEAFASYEASRTFLLGIGFKEGVEHVFDSPKDMPDIPGFPVIEVQLYQSRNGYWCAEVGDGGFMAPCVWNGPVADYDKSAVGEEFVQFLDEHYPGWR